MYAWASSQLMHVTGWRFRLRKTGVRPGVIPIVVAIAEDVATRAGLGAGGRRRERPVLSDGELVAAQRHSAPRQHHHLGARVAVPEHVAGGPAGGAPSLRFSSPGALPPPARAALRRNGAAPAPRGRTRARGRRLRGTGSPTRWPSPYGGGVDHLRVLEVEANSRSCSSWSARISFNASRPAAASPAARSRSARTRWRSTRISGGSWSADEAVGATAATPLSGGGASGTAAGGAAAVRRSSASAPFRVPRR